MSSKRITFVSCCFNEAENIVALYEGIKATMDDALSQYQWTLMLVDDGSTDDTQIVVNKLIDNQQNLKYLKLTRNFGKEAAICAGLDSLQETDAAILIDGDRQHPVEALPALIKEWEMGYDMVVAIPENRATGLRNRLLGRLFHKFMSRASKHHILLNGGDFRLISANQLDRLGLLRERSRYMKGLYSYLGGSISSINYTEKPRTGGSSQFNFLNRVSLAIDGITSFTSVPIRFFTLLGFFFLGLAVLYMIYILFGIIINGKEVPGFASLLFSIVILNGLIMIQIGVQGEYISQLLKEVKQRPIYLIDSDNSHL